MGFHPAMCKNEHVKQTKDPLDVWADISTYAATGYASIPEDEFARLRWFGFYQQKPNEGHFMWRIKLPGGRVTPGQLREIGLLANQYGQGFGDITTRQDIQLHWLKVENFPDCLVRIYNKVGLYTDFACGDNPRNITACPLDGLLPNQIVPLENLVQELSDMYRAGGKEFSNLPRKFKTSLSACPLHCHQPQINCLGAFGVIREKDGRRERGLGIVVGGGLSSTPHFAQGLRVFIPQDKIAKQIPEIFRQVCLIFRDSDELRYKRKHARLKFLVAQKGWQWFRDELERRLGYALEHDETVVNPRGALHTDHMGIGEQNNGLHYVGVPLERGRWTGDQMIAVAELTERYAAAGRGQIRLSQKQNFLLVNIPKANVDPLVKGLQAIGLDPLAPLWRDTLVSCTGMQFCNLAVVETKQRAKEILEYLEREVKLDSPVIISVSGCPNSCAQVQVVDIGLSGTKAIFQDQKVDAYDILVGGALGENPQFGTQLLPKVPSSVIHKVIGALVEGYKTNRLDIEDQDAEAFRDFVRRVPLEQLRQMAAIADWTPPPPRAGRAQE